MKKVSMKAFERPISMLGFGAMRLPQEGKEISQVQVNQMVKLAMNEGINYYDTAFVYGDGASEIAMGIALKEYPRDQFLVADKMPLFDIQGEDFLEKTFQTSLDRLQMDYIDFYLMHALDSSKVKNMKEIEAIKWALQKKKEGKIRYLGFSIHDNYDLLMEVLSLADWDFAQIQYNYMDILDNPGEKGYNELASRGIPIIIMEPLKGGILADIPQEIGKPFQDLGGSNVSYSFRWLAEKPQILTILSGMSNIEQLEQNIEIFKAPQPLTPKEYSAIAQVKKNIEASQKIGCTGCGYCMPCPLGVEIPQLFKAWNTLAIHKGNNWVSGGDMDYDNAAKCIRCGACLHLCPQHLPIPEKLAELISEKKG